MNLVEIVRLLIVYFNSYEFLIISLLVILWCDGSSALMYRALV